MSAKDSADVPTSACSRLDRLDSESAYNRSISMPDLCEPHSRSHASSTVRHGVSVQGSLLALDDGLPSGLVQDERMRPSGPAGPVQVALRGCLAQ